MKTIKKLLFLVGAVIALTFITALFVEKKFVIKRSIQINQPVSEVFEYIKYLEHQSEYTTWHIEDFIIVTDSKGIDGEEGYILKWKSKQEDIGEGEQEILKIEENQQIDSELRLKKRHNFIGKISMSTKEISSDNTELTWSFSGISSYPFNVMLLFFDFETEIGPDLEKGLKNLKEILETPE